MSLSNILILGSANLDLIMGLERLPRPGETLTNGVLSQAWGGKGANAAVGAARAGGRVQFVGCVGDDAQGPQLVAALQAAGIDTTAVRQVAGVATGTAMILLDAAGSNMIAVAPGANAHLHPEDVQALTDQFASAAMIVVQYEIPTVTLQAVLDLAVQLKRPTLFNFAPVRPLPPEYLAKLHLLVVNEVEAAALWGQPVVSVEQAHTAARALRAQGPAAVIVTLGGLGAVLADHTGEQHVPAFPVTPLDTTAAGDIFCGALAVALVEGQTLASGVRFASAAAAIAVTRLGAQPSAPLRAEIEALLQRKEHRL